MKIQDYFRHWSPLFALGVMVAGPALGQSRIAYPTEGPARPRVEINREPILTLDLTTEVVEITSEGIKKRGSTFRRGMRVGSRGRGEFRIKGDGHVKIESELLELGGDSLKMRVVVTRADDASILKDEVLSLESGQEFLIELADSDSGNSRSGLRLIPTITVKEPVLDYPGLLKRFGVKTGVLILNEHEVLSNGGSTFAGDGTSLNRESVQLLTIYDKRFGKLVFSYRAFPGSTLAGYIQGRKLVFEWEGDLFQWYSVDAPIMPDGKWALYVAREEPTFPLKLEGTSFGASERPLKSFGQ